MIPHGATIWTEYLDLPNGGQRITDFYTTAGSSDRHLIKAVDHPHKIATFNPDAEATVIRQEEF